VTNHTKAFHLCVVSLPNLVLRAIQHLIDNQPAIILDWPKDFRLFLSRRVIRFVSHSGKLRPRTCDALSLTCQIDVAMSNADREHIQPPSRNFRLESGHKPHSSSAQRKVRKRESYVKKKVLLLVSVCAMILSLALLMSPASASVTSHCTSCTALDSNGNAVTSTCHVAPVDSCFCPLSGKIIQNNCLRLP
jgi:hypothetical protein